MPKDKLPQIGDIIASPKFAYGYYDGEDKKIVSIDGQTKKQPVTFTIGEDERVAEAARTGKIPPKTRRVDLGAYDKSRGGAKFVVENAALEGGGTGHGPFDVYPDGWHVTARRLKKDGTYDPSGECITFYMTGSFTIMVDSKDLRIVGKMERSFAK